MSNVDGRQQRGGDRGGRGRGRGAEGGRGSMPQGHGGGNRGRGRGAGGSFGGFFAERGRGGRGASDRGFNGSRGGGGGPRGGGSRAGDQAPAAPIYQLPDKSIPQPDPRVMEMENKIEKHLMSQNPADRLAKLQIGSQFPLRPGYGTRGQSRVILWTNYVTMLPRLDLALHRYDITVDPVEVTDAAGKTVRPPDLAGKKVGRLLKLFLNSPEINTIKQDVVTDFRKILLSRKELSLENLVTTVPWCSENDELAAVDAHKYKVSLNPQSSLTISELMDYLSSTDLNRIYTGHQEIIQGLNILLGHHSKTHDTLVTLGANRTFDLRNANTWDLGRGLEAMRGFFSSVRLATARTLVNVNVSHGAFYHALPLTAVMDRFNGAQANVQLNQFLKRLRVEITHRVKKNKADQIIPQIKTIWALAYPGDGKKKTEEDPQGPSNLPKVGRIGAGPADVEFFYKTRYISVLDFFKQEYPSVSLANDNRYPVVNTGNDQHPVYLPAEVCVVVPGQPYRAKLDGDQTTEMIAFAVRKPSQNAESIVTQGFETVGLSSQTNPIITRFGVNPTLQLLTVAGRVLHPPLVQYRGKQKVNAQFASWNLRSVQCLTGGQTAEWTYVLIESVRRGEKDVFNRLSYENLGSLNKPFCNVLQSMGIAARQPKLPVRLHLASNDDAKLEDCLSMLAEKLDLAVIVIPDTDTGLYNQIKKIADVKAGIHTICVVGSKFGKMKGSDYDLQYMANVALKFNLKMCGRNHHVISDGLGLIEEDKTMVLGIDVTHPAPGSTAEAPSVASMVANIDSFLSQWPAELRIQQKSLQNTDMTAKRRSGVEMVQDLTDMLQNHFRRWLSHHKALPENILVYRDGVSEGQYATVLEKELPRLQKACIEPYRAYKQSLPKFSIVIVGKRHHTRFYPSKEGDKDRSDNCKNGTIVDRGITEARKWDFFLQAHTAIQGTARPAHYYVVWDQIFHGRNLPKGYKHAADVLEELTHAMCYQFGRATKAVSICPPAYYADIACDRARRYLSHVFDPVTAPPSKTAGGMKAMMDDITVHPKLQGSMFYI